MVLAGHTGIHFHLQAEQGNLAQENTATSRMLHARVDALTTAQPPGGLHNILRSTPLHRR